jgi:hypothetical protein
MTSMKYQHFVLITFILEFTEFVYIDVTFSDSDSSSECVGFFRLQQYYEGYLESNLQWAVNKTSNEKKISTKNT